VWGLLLWFIERTVVSHRGHRHTVRTLPAFNIHTAP